jgi:hypothetical protein
VAAEGEGLATGVCQRVQAVPPQDPSTDRHTVRCHGNGVISTFQKESSEVRSLLEVLCSKFN